MSNTSNINRSFPNLQIPDSSAAQRQNIKAGLAATNGATLGHALAQALTQGTLQNGANCVAGVNVNYDAEMGVITANLNGMAIELQVERKADGEYTVQARADNKSGTRSGKTAVASADLDDALGLSLSAAMVDATTGRAVALNSLLPYVEPNGVSAPLSFSQAAGNASGNGTAVSGSGATVNSNGQVKERRDQVRTSSATSAHEALESQDAKLGTAFLSFAQKLQNNEATADGLRDLSSQFASFYTANFPNSTAAQTHAAFIDCLDQAIRYYGGDPTPQQHNDQFLNFANLLPSVQEPQMPPRPQLSGAASFFTAVQDPTPPASPVPTSPSFQNAIATNYGHGWEPGTIMYKNK